MLEDGQPVWNVVKGGSTVPLKFNIDASGVEQTALSAVIGGSVALYSVGCQAGLTEEMEPVPDNTGSTTSLRYDGTQFVQNWKTPKTRLCYAARVTARDGSTITAYLQAQVSRADGGRGGEQTPPRLVCGRY